MAQGSATEQPLSAPPTPATQQCAASSSGYATEQPLQAPPTPAPTPEPPMPARHAQTTKKMGSKAASGPGQAPSEGKRQRQKKI